MIYGQGYGEILFLQLKEEAFVFIQKEIVKSE